MNILITGGASGLGLSISHKLSIDKQNKVYFTYLNSENSKNELESKYSNSKGIKCNFKDVGDIDQLLSRIDEFDIDVLINNAIAEYNVIHFSKINFSDLTKSFENNILPVLKITQKALSIFKRKKSGKVVTILTSAIINTVPTGYSEYVANKSYLLSMSKSWAAEYSKYGITSNCISPSFMDTNIHTELDERIKDMIKDNEPLKKLLTTDEVSEAVSFLVNCSQHINGINLVMNSGVNVI